MLRMGKAHIFFGFVVLRLFRWSCSGQAISHMLTFLSCSAFSVPHAAHRRTVQSSRMALSLRLFTPTHLPCRAQCGYFNACWPKQVAPCYRHEWRVSHSCPHTSTKEGLRENNHFSRKFTRITQSSNFEFSVTIVLP